MRHFLLAVAALSLSTSVLAGPLEEGMTAIGSRDWSAARKAFEAGVKAGDVEAYYHLGVMYGFGEGMTADPVRAFDLYRVAADKGYAFAQHNLANAYLNGTGVQKNLVEARRLFLLAAKQGEGHSMHNYATMLALGEGGPADAKGALEWFELAVDHEAPRVFDAINLLVEKGKMPKPDFKSLFKTRVAAAKAGDASAQYRIGMMLFYGLGTKVNAKEAERWLLASANQGHPLGALRMGSFYKDGVVRPRDLEQANGWFRKAALLDNGFAQSILGMGLFAGLGAPKDEVKGYALLVLATWHGDLSAQKLRASRLMRGVPDETVQRGKALAAQCLSVGMAKCGAAS